MEALQAVAAASGLQWVNSDSEKIAAVKPRLRQNLAVRATRTPVVVLDEKARWCWWKPAATWPP